MRWSGCMADLNRFIGLCWVICFKRIPRMKLRVVKNSSSMNCIFIYLNQVQKQEIILWNANL